VTKQFVCDVCGEPYELNEPHIELVVQEGLLGPAPEGSYDVCSWLCMYDLTLAAAGVDDPRAADQEDEVEDEPEELPTRRVKHADTEQIVITDEPRAKYAKEVEQAGTGVYFPEGMRVDGRPAEEIRPRVPKIRMVRED